MTSTLGALRPDILETKIKDAIEAELDLYLYDIEVRKHNDEVKKLEKMKTKAERFFRKELGQA